MQETPEKHRGKRDDLANWLDVVPSSMSDFVDRGIAVFARDRWGNQIKAEFDLLASVVNYIRFLRSRDRPSTNLEEALERARAIKAQADADTAALRLGILKGEYYASEEIAAVGLAQIGACRQKLFAMPTKLARLLVGQNNVVVIRGILAEEIRAAASELKGYGPEQFGARRKRRTRGNGKAA